MEEFLNNLYANTSAPLVSALVLGLLTAISPCPMATNITAIGFISKDLGNRNRVFYNGLIYTLGRTFSYTALAFILFLGADQFKISAFFQLHGEKIIGPFLLLIGILMLGIIKLNFPAFNRITSRLQQRNKFSYWNVFLLGVVFALAFCPYSGVLYFGMLIPLTISSSGLHLPVVFAIATGIPVILFAWLIAYTVSGVGRLYKSILSFEYWFRRVVALIFIGIGTYYIIAVWVLK
jgi:cytochrome c biogenesis protein CcdA